VPPVYPSYYPITKPNFNSKSEVDKTETGITKAEFKEGIDIPLIVTQRDNKKRWSYGEISIPPGLIPVGWTVAISPVNETDLHKPKPSSGKCDNKGQETESIGGIKSIAFNIVILDNRGRERSLQQLLERSKTGQGLGISLTYSMTDSDRKDFNEKNLRFVFLQEGDESWQVSGEDVDITGNGFGNISTTVSHLTSKLKTLR